MSTWLHRELLAISLWLLRILGETGGLSLGELHHLARWPRECVETALADLVALRLVVFGGEWPVYRVVVPT